MNDLSISTAELQNKLYIYGLTKLIVLNLHLYFIIDIMKTRLNWAKPWIDSFDLCRTPKVPAEGLLSQVSIWRENLD